MSTVTIILRNGNVSKVSANDMHAVKDNFVADGYRVACTTNTRPDLTPGGYIMEKSWMGGIVRDRIEITQREVTR